MMSDFFEIDFLNVESSKSGDAITIRYSVNNTKRIHVVDGGFQGTGEKVVTHIKEYYDDPDRIDVVVVSHQDGDHAGGLRTVLEEFKVGALYMLRPWDYADELIDRFSRFRSVDNLVKRLKKIYPNLAALEEIALEKNIPIYEPFQGFQIGEFYVLAPSKSRYLDLLVESEKTPESKKEERLDSLLAFAQNSRRSVINFLRSAWGEEIFSNEETSAENNMSIVQYANLCGKNILLTADAGRDALLEAADYAPHVGLQLPGIDQFQVPHHGSRRNVSTEVLDRWLGKRLGYPLSIGREKYTAIVSAAKKDKDHPRKAVVRAIYHRGGKVISTESSNIQIRFNAPSRTGWYTVNPLPYPREQEE